jgi:hypothetical protein
VILGDLSLIEPENKGLGGLGLPKHGEVGVRGQVEGLFFVPLPDVN